MISQDDAERYYAFLDAMRQSQAMMSEAPDRLMTRFGIDREMAGRVVYEWAQSYGAVRRASDQFFAALRKTTPRHDKKLKQSEAQYWLSWCAGRLQRGVSPLSDPICKNMLADAAVDVQGDDIVRRWIFRDRSSICATSATVQVR